jgi:hypothetical protein
MLVILVTGSTIMSDNENCLPSNKRTPWNKGKLIGARPPLRPQHVPRQRKPIRASARFVPSTWDRSPWLAAPTKQI